MSLLARVRGFRGLDLDVAPGDIILLRGPNGSGKTSLLRALAGLEQPFPCRVERAPRAALSPQDARDALIGLTVSGEFRLRRAPVPARLAPLAGRASTELSSGETRRLVLAASEGAPLLLLDEPAEGLDPSGVETLRAAVARAATSGAVVVAEHGGALDALATRALELAPAPRAPLPPLPRAQGAPVLTATAARVRGIDLPALALGPGFHVLRGANGAGKSTLLLRLAGILDATGVRVAGAPPEPGRTARLLLPHAGDLLTRARVADEHGKNIFSDLLVPRELADRHPLSLSGGEAQRVALAKTLGAPAPCYLLDEPEAHLDAAGRVALVEAIAARVKEGACVLAATHDEALASLAQTEVRV